MLYFAIQVRTLHEDDFARRIGMFPDTTLAAIVPKRKLKIKRGTKIIQDLQPVFPGYIFIGVQNHEHFRDMFMQVRQTKFFGRFLPSNLEPKELSGFDLEILTHFISHGQRADASKVRFDENDRIVVLSGPLKGLEGHIVKVDRRKGRAKIRLEMCRDSFAFDLAFETVELVPPGDAHTHVQQ